MSFGFASNNKSANKATSTTTKPNNKENNYTISVRTGPGLNPVYGIMFVKVNNKNESMESQMISPKTRITDVKMKLIVCFLAVVVVHSMSPVKKEINEDT